MSLSGITGTALFKYAPFFFCMVTDKGLRLDIDRLIHTLIVSAIVAGVTMYGTQRVLDTRIAFMEKELSRLTSMAEEAIRVQREIVPMRNLQIKALQDAEKAHEERIAKLERKR